MQFLYWTKCRNANPFPFPFFSRVVWYCLRESVCFLPVVMAVLLLGKVWYQSMAARQSRRTYWNGQGKYGLQRRTEIDSWARLDAPERSRNVTVVLIGWPQRLLRLGGTPREKECNAQTRTQDDSSAFIHRYLYVGPKLPAPYFCFAKGHVLES